MRPAPLDPWFFPLRQLRGVGDAVLAQLARLLGKDEPVIRDLLMHRPFDVIDRSLTEKISAESDGQIVTLNLHIDAHYAASYTRNRRAPYRIACHNDQLTLNLLFFHAKGDYLSRQYPKGEERLISGKLEQGKQGWQIVHPQLVAKPEQRSQVATLEPVYPLTAGLHHRKLHGLIQQACKQASPLPEWQNAAWIRQQNWPGFSESLLRLHKPEQREDISTASPYFQRLAYDELLSSQLALALVRERMRKAAHAPVIAPSQQLRPQLLQSLPFTLTSGQQQVLAEIDADMASGQRMLRLLQGDVGSGKTVVALAAMLSAVEAGGQAALMVPTEILGRQHLAAFERILAPLNIPVAMLYGSADPQEKREILAQLADGRLPIVIGTHAVFQESVSFQRLMLAVIDEQHRFGVNQRLKLADKGHATHMLLMSATPIPRSLTMTLFGDMDVSILKQKPAGRQEIITRAMPLSRYEKVMQAVEDALSRGEKIYWICPLVEGSETAETDLAAATERHREFAQRFQRLTEVTLVHGRIKGEARESEMQRFARGDSRLLVATTVVEVGVDVPDATIMVIEHAERFGLAQLHQLRGRVGRGNKASSCLLLYADKIGEHSVERLRVMRESNDGFYLAEEDLRLRGGGEILGTRQSGLPGFHFAELPRDENLLHVARDQVKLTLQQDALLQSSQGEALRYLLYLFGQDEKLRYLKS